MQKGLHRQHLNRNGLRYMFQTVTLRQILSVTHTHNILFSCTLLSIDDQQIQDNAGIYGFSCTLLSIDDQQIQDNARIYGFSCTLLSIDDQQIQDNARIYGCHLHLRPPLTCCLPMGHFWAHGTGPLSASGPLLGPFWMWHFANI